MDWVGLAEIIGGSVAAPFTGGATIPIALAGVQHMASSKAADQQAEASKAVQGQNQQMYTGQSAAGNNIFQGQQQNLAPYTSLGSGAASLLGAGLGIKVSPGATGPMQPFETRGFTPGLSSAPIPATSQGNFQPGPDMARGTPFPGQGAAPLTAAVQRRSSYGGGTVQMRAPDGTIQAVPADQVEHYRSRGGQVVS